MGHRRNFGRGSNLYDDSSAWGMVVIAAVVVAAIAIMLLVLWTNAG